MGLHWRSTSRPGTFRTLQRRHHTRTATLPRPSPTLRQRFHDSSVDSGLTGAVESSLGEVPEGWIQAYGPASIVEILHNGIPTEVELIEPLLLDPFGSATFQFWTDSAGSR